MVYVNQPYDNDGLYISDGSVKPTTCLRKESTYILPKNRNRLVDLKQKHELKVHNNLPKIEREAVAIQYYSNTSCRWVNRIVEKLYRISRIRNRNTVGR